MMMKAHFMSSSFGDSLVISSDDTSNSQANQLNPPVLWPSTPFTLQLTF